VAEAKTEEEEDSASILSHAAADNYSSLASASAPEVDATSSAADSADVVPDNLAIEDSSAEEWTEVVPTLTSPRSPATAQVEVARVDNMGDVPESAYSVAAEQSTPAHELSVSMTSESREDALSLPSENLISTSTPVSPALRSLALEDVSASHVSALPMPEGEVVGPDDVDNEDEWSEVEA